MSDLVQDLRARRVPQYIAVYIGASWGLVEFMAFMEERYLVSPHWTNLLLMLLALLLPSVALFAYNHGRPGTDRWRRSEKIAIPVNLLLAAVILFAGFGSKDLGAMTTTVVAEDESGNRVEREILKEEFRKRLMLFPPASPDTEEDAWLGQAVSSLLATDLFQDASLDLRVPFTVKEQLAEAGVTEPARAPRGLKRQVTQELHIPYFLDGDVRRAEEGFVLQLGLHETEGGAEVETFSLAGPDLFALVDSSSVLIRTALDLPARHLETTPDLPVSDLTTESLEALAHYSRGSQAWLENDDYTAASAALHRALEADPTFASAASSLFYVDLLRGDAPAARAALKRAMDHMYRLPERTQFPLKAEWYGINGDQPKAFAVYEMWAELYPQDTQALQYVAQVRELQNDVPGSIRALERILELDPSQEDFLPVIADKYQRLGQFGRAEERYARYADRHPTNAGAHLSIGRLRALQGDHDGARSSLERALLLDPGNVKILAELAELDRNLGQWAAAEARLQEALAAGTTPAELETVHGALFQYHSYRRDRVRALEHAERAAEQSALYQPPLAVVQQELMMLGAHVRAGRGDYAIDRLETMAAQLAPPADMVLPFARVELFASLEQPEPLEAALRSADQLIETSGVDMLAPQVAYGWGRLHEMRGEWSAALEAYERERILKPTDSSIPAQLGQVRRKMGDYAGAIDLLQQTLAIRPSDGRANYELGLSYLGLGRPGDAIAPLERAVETWAPADPRSQVEEAEARLEGARKLVRARRAGG